MKKELIVSRDPKSPISEIIRTLRTNLQFFSAKGKLKSILVTSTMPSEGKSWVSSNLAIAFAQAGKRVILIDADMRKGRLYSLFEISQTPGLSNYLSGMGTTEEDDAIDIIKYLQATEVENLLIMPAGNVPPNPSELLGTERMVEMIEKMKDISDIIIIDGTPNQLVTDALIITRLVDATLVVTADKKTKKEDLKRVVNNIEQVGGKIAGIVINMMPQTAKAYEKTYYYYGNSTSSKKGKETTKSKTTNK